jgi:hypothetical protein
VGLTVLTIEVSNPSSPKITEKLEFLADSGAIYSVVPAPILKKLGIKPLVTEEFRLADGSKIHRKKGVAVFKYGKRIGGADVIFGEKGIVFSWERSRLKRSVWLLIPSAEVSSRCRWS